MARGRAGGRNRGGWLLRCALAASATALVATSVTETGFGATPAPDGPRLAFTSMTTLESRGFRLQTVSPDGSGRVVLLRGSKRGVSPLPASRISWSPDGSWLYFAGRDGRRRGIYKLRPDGSGLRFLRGTGESKEYGGGTNPVVSPDGTKLAFSRDTYRRGYLPTGTAIWVGDEDGRNASQLRRWDFGTDVVPSSIAPDNSELAVSLAGWASPRTNVSLIRLDRTRRVRVLAEHASEAAFSPDGSKIALVRHTVSSRSPRYTVDKDLYVMNTDGSKSTPVTSTTHVAETQPSWDPSGQRIAFNSFHNSKDFLESLFDELLPVNNSIAEINADGRCRRRVLKLNGAILRGGAWQPGSDRAPGPIEC